MLKNVLQGVMDERKLSARGVGEATGVAHTTILRVLQGDQIDLATLIKLAEWLEIRPSQLLDSFANANEESMDARVAVLVDAYPELREVFEKAAAAIEEGRADPAIIKDIATYAQYKIDQAE